MKNIWEKLAAIDSFNLYCIGGAPILLWGVGLFLQGSDVFVLGPKNENSQIETLISVKRSEVKSPEEIKAELAKREQEALKEKRKEKSIVPDTRKLSDKYSTISALEKKLEEKDQEQESKETAEEPKIVYVPVKRSRKEETLPTESPRPEEPSADADPYASFQFKKRESVQPTTNENSKSVSKVKDPNWVASHYNAQFAENKTFNLKRHKTLLIRNTEDIHLYDGTVIPRNTVMTGYVSRSKDRLKVKVNQFKTRSSIHQVNLSLYDNQGTEGLFIQQMSEMMGEVQNSMDDIARDAMNDVQISAPLVGSVKLPMRRRNNEPEVFISTDVTFKLVEQ